MKRCTVEHLTFTR